MPNKDNHIYDKQTRTWFDVTPEQFREYDRWRTRIRKREQAHGHCMCPRSKWWLCDGMCQDCEFHAAGDTISLDAPVANDDGDEVSLGDTLMDPDSLFDSILCDKAEMDMPQNTTVKAQRQSLRNIHYALLTSDTAEGVSYEKPEPLVGAISASISPTTNQEKLWADDGVFDIASQLGDITLELELAALPMKAQAILLGHKYEKGVMVQNASDEAPYVAIGFMSQPQPNQFRCVWLYKGKFQLVEDEYSTSNDSPAWRQPKLTGTFVQRDYDGNWQISADTSDPEFTGVDSWFNEVYEETKETNGEG